MTTNTITLVALGAFALGATAVGLLTWAACTLHRDRYYIRRHRKEPSTPLYSRKQKHDGLI